MKERTDLRTVAFNTDSDITLHEAIKKNSVSYGYFHKWLNSPEHEDTALIEWISVPNNKGKLMHVRYHQLMFID